MRGGNEETATSDFEVQETHRDRIDVRAVGGNGAAIRALEAAEYGAEPGGGAVVGQTGKNGIGDGIRADSVDLTSALIGPKIKELALDDGTADHAAELVLLQRGTLHALAIEEEVVGIEDVIANELEKGAVDLVAA